MRLVVAALVVLIVPILSGVGWAQDPLSSPLAPAPTPLPKELPEPELSNWGSPQGAVLFCAKNLQNRSNSTESMECIESSQVLLAKIKRGNLCNSELFESLAVCHS